MESLCFILFCGEFEEFFVGLNRVGDKLSVAEQRVSRNRRGNVPGGFFVGYMNRFERNSVFFRNFAHPRNPVACERAIDLCNTKRIRSRLFSGASRKV